jgi:starvation-inducible DNA-binding protein
MKVDIGMTAQELKHVAEGLQCLLADTYALYLKTHNFHWNMIGEPFIGLHKLLEEQYEGMAEAVDEIAERIRALGHFVDATFASFSKKTKIKDHKPTTSWKEMVKALVKGHELISKRYRPFILDAQENNDEMTADLVIERLRFHEKAAWLLRSHIKS